MEKGAQALAGRFGTPGGVQGWPGGDTQCSGDKVGTGQRLDSVVLEIQTLNGFVHLWFHDL